MAALPTARRKNLAAARTLHPRAEAVSLGAAAFARLIGALWQSKPPCVVRTAAGAHFTAADLASSAKLSSSPVPTSAGVQRLPQRFAN